MNKEKALSNLRSRIIDQIFINRWEDVWFFPKYKNTKGYLGTQDILFLSVNPSTGVFPSKFDRWYYAQLEKNGFKNAHLTDVFKQRSQNWERLTSNNRVKREAKRFLAEEIKIIRPKLIVYVGKRYTDFYNEMVGNVKAGKITIAHYAFRYGSDKKLRARVRKEIRRVKTQYMKQG